MRLCYAIPYHMTPRHGVCNPSYLILLIIDDRKTNVAASEAGGITQKLSAFSVNIRDR